MKAVKKVLLIDIDSKIPNLALMKISTFYKSKGCEVGFDVRDPDVVYASVVFEKNKHKVDGLQFYYPDAEIHVGGSGYDLSIKLPDEIECLKPDYDLYPDCDYSLGFTTRGCIRKCHFCIVPEKEGIFRIVQHPREWHDPRFKKIVFLDNNILADKAWFLEVANWCIENKLSAQFTQGLDIRLVDEEIGKILLKIKHFKGLFFAWDILKDEEIIKEKIALLKSVGFTNSMLKHKVQFYIYVDSDSEYDSGVYRCMELKKLSCSPYVMYNVRNPPTRRIQDLRRWANLKWLFWGVDMDEYYSHKKPVKQS
jgi:hypothetical protein